MQPHFDVDPLLRSLELEARELWVSSSVPRIEFHPSALEFLRDYVQCNTPVIFTGVPIPPWSRSRNSLDSHAGHQKITVNWTADGRGDAVRSVQQRKGDRTAEQIFVKPFQDPCSLKAFLDALCDGSKQDNREVPYYSQQNDCLRQELPQLLRDLPDMAFAAEAFGSQPDAVNLWIGDSRSVSSMHKDPYENMFLVTAGQKVFTLRPPCDVTLLDEQEFVAATYVKGRDGLLHAEIDVPESRVSWIVSEPTGDDVACPVVCEVSPGEMLYLPAYWYHRVEQQDFTVGIKYVTVGWERLAFQFSIAPRFAI